MGQKGCLPQSVPPFVPTQAPIGDPRQGGAVSVGPIWYACIAIHPAKHQYPLKRDEDVRSLIKAFANETRVDLEEYLICVANRLPTKGEIPPIIVKFSDYERRKKLKKKTKRVRPTTEDRLIFLKDHLMAKTTILKKKKSPPQEEKLKYVWICGGEVF